MLLSFQTILETLTRHEVEFVVVGGVAAVLHGAPVTTFDFDALIRVSLENTQKLLAALHDLDARFRHHDPPLRPTQADLLAGGHLLLLTSAGPLDLLGFIGDQQRFEDLSASVQTIQADGYAFNLLSVEELIKQKRWLGRDKDLVALRMLEQLRHT
jgi:hypothetical protein